MTGVAGCGSWSAEDESELVASASDFTTWERPADQPVFTVDHNTNHDAVFFVEPETAYPYKMIVCHRDREDLWRTTEFHWSASHWELVDDAYRVAGGARWRATPSVRVSGSYRMERGAGAFLSSGDVSARWTVSDDLTLGLHGTAAQQIEEFRLGEGVVAGGGLTGPLGLSDRLRLDGGAAVYRRLFENRPAQVDWNQVRAWTSLRVKVGGDPGRSGGAW